jgi:methyltransferase family protein
VRIPEPSSTWPVRVVGDPFWIRASLKHWDNVRWRDPRSAVDTFYLNIRYTDYFYRLTRLARPTLAVETGVHYGRSSVAILAALRRNGSGRLVSIDLPKVAGSVNVDGRVDSAHVRSWNETGHLVPRELRDRWELRLGDARELLPKAVAGGVGFFLHDSDHSYAHQAFEYETAWAALVPGGILASDDTDWSAAWPEFLERYRGAYQPLEDGPLAVRAVRKVE